MSFGMPGPTGKPQSVKGTGMKSLTMQNFSPEQMELFKGLFGQLSPQSFMGKLAGGGSEEMWRQMETPALERFSSLQGNLASRFGGSGGMKSSGFKNAMTGANQQFASQLASQRMGLQMDAWDRLMSMSNQLLNQRPYENFLVAKKQPFWQQATVAGTQGLAQGIGQAAGAYAGGKIG